MPAQPKPRSSNERCPSCGGRLQLWPALNESGVVRLCPACGLQPETAAPPVESRSPLPEELSGRLRRLTDDPSGGADAIPEWMIEDLPRQARDQIQRLAPPPGPRLGPRLSEALAQALQGRGLTFGGSRRGSGNGRHASPGDEKLTDAEGWIASRLRCEQCDAGLSAADKTCPWCGHPRASGS
ncbi:MAG: hypothetical protein ACK2T2_06970 [Anaerolineales bacterium]|jgi:predicted RNA-binding Zn-ribbon protein involved in translation (DUF1610 family)